ncbi:MULTISPECIES: ImmA/IrrE family metallo-endopeptidase [Microbacterium]|uniref:IrrE N-terminal-like domain-containing protein n=1 Tax=Microbacterium testaceum TaxID=2033 RepID=A0A4Y3QGD1_MICTE|nr:MULTISPECIES: ImmA/IrrE family metallo-endopeptidase [Microbacterium]MDZ5143583.1 ImmA/IrrE family metallo-endopeptidase [Microbacterium testaceum]PNW09683.1 ImmA/IrrE family metallo-endopeptidase [Microbacterium testaceum]REC99686.1 uncharacterized protein DUF955 [Microbacterium sp. AG157]WJS91607.1 ImmA/IrrE family metallo-endopeptidase [Microbacterium testaceum]GEB44251.1 hypothetical protein MTE01_01960 [Microbacterium testaceum]
MRELLALAARLGVTVHVAHLPEPYRGFYDHERRMIVYDFTLTPVERACVVAHELGHAFHGHRGPGDPRAEAAADAYAARLLVDPERFARLEAMGLPENDIAEELGVTPKLLRVFLENDLTRLRGVTYTRARLGRGQFHSAERWAS